MPSSITGGRPRRPNGIAWRGPKRCVRGLKRRAGGAKGARGAGPEGVGAGVEAGGVEAVAAAAGGRLVGEPQPAAPAGQVEVAGGSDVERAEPGGRIVDVALAAPG